MCSSAVSNLSPKLRPVLQNDSRDDEFICFCLHKQDRTNERVVFLHLVVVIVLLNSSFAISRYIEIETSTLVVFLC